mgnify:CR=1 FL=1
MNTNLETFLEWYVRATCREIIEGFKINKILHNLIKANKQVIKEASFKRKLYGILRG